MKIVDGVYFDSISTRYRAPECLLTDGYYRNQMDIWSAGKESLSRCLRYHLFVIIGCVMYEIITLKPLFPGSNELDQINRIHDVLGTPPPSVLDKFQQ